VDVYAGWDEAEGGDGGVDMRANSRKYVAHRRRSLVVGYCIIAQSSRHSVNRLITEGFLGTRCNGKVATFTTLGFYLVEFPGARILLLSAFTCFVHFILGLSLCVRACGELYVATIDGLPECRAFNGDQKLRMVFESLFRL